MIPIVFLKAKACCVPDGLGERNPFEERVPLPLPPLFSNLFDCCFRKFFLVCFILRFSAYTTPKRYCRPTVYAPESGRTSQHVPPSESLSSAAGRHAALVYRYAAIAVYRIHFILFLAVCTKCAIYGENFSPIPHFTS